LDGGLRPGSPCALAVVDTHLLLLAGPTLGSRFIRWNFVSSSNEKIERAARDWKRQTFPKIPGDDQDFVPLSEPFR
jgi:hypothetical protein